jgi:predicted DNA-binding transcriptional regulator AlpA
MSGGLPLVRACQQHLTQASCETAEPGDRMRDESDGGGLSLTVWPSGVKRWSLRWTRPGGAQPRLGLGPLRALDGEPEPTELPVLGQPMTLAQARALAEELRARIGRGDDPAAERDHSRWLEKRRAGWRSRYRRRHKTRATRRGVRGPWPPSIPPGDFMKAAAAEASLVGLTFAEVAERLLMVTAPDLRRQLGWSLATFERRLRDPQLGFPRPLVIGGGRYFRMVEVEAWIVAQPRWDPSRLVVPDKLLIRPPAKQRRRA